MRELKKERKKHTGVRVNGGGFSVVPCLMSVLKYKKNKTTQNETCFHANVAANLRYVTFR